MSKIDFETKLGIGFMGCWLLWVILCMALIIAGVGIAAHFIGKVW